MYKPNTENTSILSLQEEFKPSIFTM